MPDARSPEAKRSATLPALPPDDWRQSLPEDWTAPGRDANGGEAQIPLRQHPALAKYASKDEAIKALVHAQRLLGKKGEAEPGSLLSPAPAASAPPSPGDYVLPDIALPENFRVDEPLRQAYLEQAHALGLSDAQAGGLYAWFLPLNVRAACDHAEQRTAKRRQGRERELAALRKAHGGAAASVLEQARRAVLALGGQQLLQRLEACGAADDAQIVQALARVAPLVSESALRGAGAGPAQSLSAQRLRQMMRDPRYHDPARRDEDFVRQVRQGFEALYPGETEAGSRG